MNNNEICYICDKPTNKQYVNKYNKTEYYICDYCSENLEIKYMIMSYDDKTLEDNK